MAFHNFFSQITEAADSERDPTIKPPDEHISKVKWRARADSENYVGAYVANRLRATGGKESIEHMADKLAEYGLSDGNTTANSLSVSLVRHKKALKEAGRHEELNSIPRSLHPSPTRDMYFAFFDKHEGKLSNKEQSQRLSDLGHDRRMVDQYRLRWNRRNSTTKPLR